MTLLLRRLRINWLLKIAIRCKHAPNHWSVLKKKVAPSDKALEHFDDFYKTVYGESWQNIRSALLKKNNKHMAILNNFGDVEKTVEKLELLGAINMKSLYEAQRRNLANRKKQPETVDAENVKLEDRMENMLSDKQMEELRSLYPRDYEPSGRSLDEASDRDEKTKIDEPMKPVQMRPIEEDLANAKLEESRIVKPSIGITSSSLHEYIPATKIKGLDDWILESDHYSYYNRAADFTVEIEKDPLINFPKHLKIYTFEARNDTRFPSPRRGTVEVFDYYLMDGGSILPVLALDLQPGDTVLDMCAAPGGKTFAALQTLMPRVLVANDVKLGRVNRINDVLDEYLGDLGVWNNRLFVTNKDAREMDETDLYNKILVDVPCTTDRHVLHEDDNSIFKPARLRERLQLPELQAAILAQALKLVAPGGIVVYSTCSLSPIQNDGVVQMALKKNWEDTKSSMIVMDMAEALEPLRCLYKFGDFGLKYGHIVIPTKANNWGPMYFCKITRTR